MLELTSFIAGMLSTALAYAMFTSNKNLEPAEVMEDDYGLISRKVEIMCVSCRKKRPHIEVEPNLYECKHCKRQLDLRR